MATAQLSFAPPLQKHESSGTRHWRFGWRTLGVAAIATLGALLAVVVGANVLLSFGFSGDRVNVSFGQAWTFWPTTVHVRDMRLVFEDDRVQGSAELSRGVFDIRLADLLARKFHATRVTGDGLRLRLRYRVAPQSAARAWVASLPPIHGLADPPLLEAAPAPRGSGSQQEPWTVHLEDVDVAAEEIWIQFVRYEGAAMVRGGFRWRPTRELWVDPSSLEIERGQLTVANRVVTQSLHGIVRAEVDAFDVRFPVGAEVLRYMSGHIDLTLGGPRVVTALSVPSRSGSSGLAPSTVQITVRIDHGRLVDGTRLDVTTTRASIQVPRFVSALGTSV